MLISILAILILAHPTWWQIEFLKEARFPLFIACLANKRLQMLGCRYVSFNLLSISSHNIARILNQYWSIWSHDIARIKDIDSQGWGETWSGQTALPSQYLLILLSSLTSSEANPKNNLMMRRAGLSSQVPRLTWMSRQVGRGTWLDQTRRLVGAFANPHLLTAHLQIGEN